MTRPRPPTPCCRSRSSRAPWCSRRPPAAGPPTSTDLARPDRHRAPAASSTVAAPRPPRPRRPARPSLGGGEPDAPRPTRRGGRLRAAPSAACRITLRRRPRAAAGPAACRAPLTFTNTGSTACTLTRASPASRSSAAATAPRSGRPPPGPTTRCRPGRSRRATTRQGGPAAHAAAATTATTCRQTKVDGFRVFPPGSTESAFVAFPTTGCKSADVPLLQVGPVR